MMQRDATRDRQMRQAGAAEGERGGDDGGSAAQTKPLNEWITTADGDAPPRARRSARARGGGDDAEGDDADDGCSTPDAWCFPARGAARCSSDDGDGGAARRAAARRRRLHDASTFDERDPDLRTYDIEIDFTIVADSPKDVQVAADAPTKGADDGDGDGECAAAAAAARERCRWAGLRRKLVNNGYCVPDPADPPSRMTV